MTIGTHATFLGTGPGGLGGADRCGDVADPGGGDPATRPGRAGAAADVAAWLLGRSTSIGSAAGPSAGPAPPLLSPGVARPSLDRNPVLWRECRRKRPSRWSLAVWGTYVLLCGGFGLYAIAVMIERQPLGPRARHHGQRPPGGGRAAAAQRLGRDEPGRGAPAGQPRRADGHAAAHPGDRLGQVVGRLPAVPPLLVLPVVLTTALSFHTGRLWGVALMAALILAYGAAITSLGLALATWIPRMGHAAAMTVGLYTFHEHRLDPPDLYRLPGEGRGRGLGVAAGSPPMGVGVYSSMLAGDGPPREFAARRSGPSSGRSPTAASPSPCCWPRSGRSTAAWGASTIPRSSMRTTSPAEAGRASRSGPGSSRRAATRQRNRWRIRSGPSFECRMAPSGATTAGRNPIPRVSPTARPPPPPRTRASCRACWSGTRPTCCPG